MEKRCYKNYTKQPNAFVSHQLFLANQMDGHMYMDFVLVLFDLSLAFDRFGF